MTGFKSFAGKTVLNLEREITAVVGPNGSGKSNLADAIRWTLGEQSKSRLRLHGRDEVVFAGTEKRARASFAEVTLLFNNDDGVFSLDLTEVEISRRLYRSGESDYRLNGRSVRLQDIQQLLAEAGFGTNTYAVIGQGMIDNFLMSSPAERKLLFDEAAGIRGSELKRESALRKLEATAANLVRLEDIRAELEPRLASLQQTMTAAEEQAKLEVRREELRAEWVAATARDIEAQHAGLITERTRLQTQLHRLRHDQRELDHQQQARLRAARHQERERLAVQAEVRRIEAQYERRLDERAELNAHLRQVERELETARGLWRRETELMSELKTTTDRLAETTAELKHDQTGLDQADRTLVRIGREVTKAQARLEELRQAVSDGTQQQYIKHALAMLQTVSKDLVGQDVSLQDVRLMVYKAGRLLSHASKTSDTDVVRELRTAQVQLERAMTRRETAIEHQTNLTITQRSLEIDAAHLQSLQERLTADLARVRGVVGDHDTRQAELTALKAAATAADKFLDGLRHRLQEQRRQLETVSSHVGATAAVAQAATRLEQLRNHTEAAEQRLGAIRAGFTGLTARRHELRVQAQTWKITASSTIRATAEPATIERSLIALEAELLARQDLQRGAITEYEEVKTRYEDLATQITDLTQARADLGQVVDQLNGVIRERFKENFAALGQHFSAYFTRLFGGGTASLELEEAEDGTYGIAIQASPKGKRQGNLAALSGGERAMAGVALLAAILRVNPSPFVVLDEVDAALDEANSSRLAGILDELAEASQLIIITHNRQTMKAAKTLFGVTMNEHHVSHLLSMRLEEASAIAAR